MGFVVKWNTAALLRRHWMDIGIICEHLSKLKMPMVVC